MRKKIPKPEIKLPVEAVKPAHKKPMVLERVDGDDAEDERHDRERDDAFRASPFEWNGKPLAAFAVDREGDWLAFRASVGAASIDIAWNDPAAFMPDAFRILWFCSHEPEVWMPLMRTPLELDAAIRGWSRDNVPQGEQFKAVDTAIEIYTRAHTNRATVKPSGKAGKLGK